MKKTGILNAQLIGLIAALGHKDTFMVGDAGMPIPAGVPIVDLVLCGGVPTFRQTMDAIPKDIRSRKRLMKKIRNCLLTSMKSYRRRRRRRSPMWN